VNWRAELQGEALRHVHGLPAPAFELLVRTLARICDDPCDPVFSSPVPSSRGRRVADLGDWGFIEFIVDDEAGLVSVYSLVRTA